MPSPHSLAGKKTVKRGKYKWKVRKVAKSEIVKASQESKAEKSQLGRQLSIKCFTVGCAKDQSEGLISPEYRMADKKKKRKHSKKEEEVPDINGDDADQDTHSVILPCPDIIDAEDFIKQSLEEQVVEMVSTLNKLIEKVIEVDIAINHDSDGIHTKICTAQTTVDATQLEIQNVSKKYDGVNAKVSSNTQELQDLKAENVVLKGIVQKQSNQLKTMNSKIAMLTARSMQNNIIISGLQKVSSKKENCKNAVITFLKQQVEIDVEDNEIIVAHRIGQYRWNATKPRLMLVRCVEQLKERIFKNVKNLKDKKDSTGNPFYVNKQLPDELAEQNRAIRQTIKEQKDKEDGLSAHDKTKIEVKNRKVYFDGEEVIQHLKPVTCVEMFPDKPEREKQEKIKLYSADPHSENNSNFQVYACKAGQIHEVRRAYRKVQRLHPAVDHVVAAYVIRNHKGYQDNREHGAAHKLLKTLENEGCNNVAVYVVQSFGGKHMGSRRFEVINECGLQAIRRLTNPT